MPVIGSDQFQLQVKVPTCLPSAYMLREVFDKYPPMAMHVDKPSKEWKNRLAEQLNQTGSGIYAGFVDWLQRVSQSKQRRI